MVGDRVVYRHMNGDVIVDAEDYHILKYGIVRITTGRIKYCTVGPANNSKLLHRLILNITNPKIYVDHINGNGLDCRKENLRTCTTQQNQFNSKAKNKNGLPKGIVKVRNLYRVRISKNYIQYNLGYFITLDEAVFAYNKKAEELFGEFAYHVSR